MLHFLKDADKKIKQLKENCDELCKEVIQRKAEINALKEGVSSKQKLMLIDKKEVENILEKQANLKVTQNLLCVYISLCVCMYVYMGTCICPRTW